MIKGMTEDDKIFPPKKALQKCSSSILLKKMSEKPDCIEAFVIIDESKKELGHHRAQGSLAPLSFNQCVYRNQKKVMATITEIGLFE